MVDQPDSGDSTLDHDAGRQRIIAATIAEWQKHLLQLDRRNGLLYFKARSAVRLIVSDVDEFVVSLESSRRGLSFLYAERRDFASSEGDEDIDQPRVHEVPGDLEADLAPLDLQRRLRRLRQRDREYEEEQGLNVLFAAVGFLEWTDADGQAACSPLLLVPCDLQWSPRNPYRLIREEDDVEINRTLVHRMSKEGITLPEYPPDQAPSDYLRSVEDAVKSRDGWKVNFDVQLATLQYSKMAMWEDLEHMRVERCTL